MRDSHATSPGLEDVGALLTRLQRPDQIVQVAVIVVAVLFGWWLSKSLRSRLTVASDPDNLPDRLREMLYVGAPQGVTLAVLAAIDGLMHALGVEAGMVDTAVQLVGLLLLIRLAVYVFRVSLGTRARIKGWGVPISAVIWVFVALHVLGWGAPVIAALDSIGIDAGKTRISVWSVLKLLVTVSAFVVVALWVSRWLERRVLKLDALAPTMRIGIAKFLQAF